MDTPGQILAEHAEWVRRLARRLVGDPHLADDLAQQTCLAALRGPAVARSGEPRRWLAAILRNFVRQDRRTVERRARRELGAARPEALPSTADLVARLALQRSVSAEVERLPEPYRTAILLRFVEGLGGDEIAARMAANPSTVRTWIDRGLERLRRQLDARHGRRDAWLAPLGAWLGVPHRPGVVTAMAAGLTGIGVLLMNTKWIATAAVVVLAGVTATVLLRDDTAPGGGVAPPTGSDAAASTRRAETSPGGAPDVVTRAPVPTRTAPDATTGAADAALVPVRGEVRDTTGGLLPDVPVRAGEARATSGGDGAFTVAVAPASFVAIRADADEWHTELGAAVEVGERGPATTPVVVVARSVDVRGDVRDADGRPLAGARVTRVLPVDLRARIGVVLDHCEPTGCEARTGPDGRFAFDAIGAVDGAVLRATLDGHVPAELALPPDGGTDLRFVLGRPDPVDGALLGIVFDHTGLPAADCDVSLGSAATTTGADGRFSLQLADAPNARTLHAIRRGALPAVRTFEPDELAGPTPFVTLELGAVPLRITGTVVDERGAPVADARVWVTDPQAIGRLGGSTASVEGFLAGGLTRDEMRARFLVDGRPVVGIEQLLRDTPTAAWGWTRTDAGGAFELDGLLDRDYTIAVLRSDSLARSEAGPFRAGSAGVVVRVDAAAVHEVVAGCVVGRDGAPIAGVQVHAQCDPMRLAIEGLGASIIHATAPTTVETDGDGRFRLERVGADRVYLRIDGERIVPVEYGRGVAGGITAVDGRPADDLRIVVPRRVHARVELVDPTEADTLAVEDEAGRRRPIDVVQGRSRTSMNELSLQDGRSPVVSLTDDVVAVVLLRGITVVRRVPVRLAPGDVNELRL